MSAECILSNSLKMKHVWLLYDLEAVVNLNIFQKSDALTMTGGIKIPPTRRIDSFMHPPYIETAMFCEVLLDSTFCEPSPRAQQWSLCFPFRARTCCPLESPVSQGYRAATSV